MVRRFQSKVMCPLILFEELKTPLEVCRLSNTHLVISDGDHLPAGFEQHPMEGVLLQWEEILLQCKLFISMDTHLAYPW